MKISLNLFSCSQEAAASGNQVVQAFAVEFSRACSARPDFEYIAEVSFGVGLMHPIGYVQRRASGSYHRDTRTFFASAEMDYLAWVTGRWLERVGVVASALTQAIWKIHKTRITVSEREGLLAALAEAAAVTACRPPEALIRLEPILISKDNFGKVSGIGFSTSGGPMQAGDVTTILQPEDIEAFLRDHPAPPEPGPPPFKLYRRLGDQIEYREAWVDGAGDIVEHWGVCGERGEVRRHIAGSVKAQKSLLTKLKSTARLASYRAIPLSRHRGLLVSKAIVNFGAAGDLDERHALEDFLNNLTGWLGLGHCDGGSIGSGSMEAFCWVVDFDIAAAAVTRELQASRFSAFSVTQG